MKRGREKRGNVKEKRRMGKEKGRNGKEKEKIVKYVQKSMCHGEKYNFRSFPDQFIDP
jgi:hypothetical protein